MAKKKDTTSKEKSHLFQKGKSGNPNGRPKGSVNKTTAQLREVITQFVTKELSEVEQLVMKLEPKDRAKFLTDLLKYSLPTLSSVSMDSKVEGTITKIEVSYKDK